MILLLSTHLCPYPLPPFRFPAGPRARVERKRGQVEPPESPGGGESQGWGAGWGKPGRERPEGAGGLRSDAQHSASGQGAPGAETAGKVWPAWPPAGWTACPLPSHSRSVPARAMGLQTSGRGPWPKRSPLVCEGRDPLPFPGGWLGLCFQQRSLCPPRWTGLPPAWGPDGCDLGFVGRDTGRAQTLRCPGVRAHISGHSSLPYDPQFGSESHGAHLGAVSPVPAPAGNTLYRALHVLFPLRTLGAGSRGCPAPPLCLQQPPSECPWGRGCPALP